MVGRNPVPGDHDTGEGSVADMTSSADIRLASYGTLAPGRENHHQLAGLDGYWRQGTVRGTLIRMSSGYLGLILDPQGPLVEVHLFESPDLLTHWLRLDAFEGPGYRRVTTRVSTTDGDADASIYV